MQGYLLDEVSGAVSFGQVDLLAEGDVGGLGGDLPAVLALELRSGTEKRASKPRSAPCAIDMRGTGSPEPIEPKEKKGMGTRTLR